MRLGKFLYIDKILINKLERYSHSLTETCVRNNVFIFKSFKNVLTGQRHPTTKPEFNTDFMKTCRRFSKALLHIGRCIQAREMFKKFLIVCPHQQKITFRHLLSSAPCSITVLFDGSIFRRLKCFLKRRK